MSMDTKDNKDRFEMTVKQLRDRQEMEKKEYQMQFGTLKNATVQYKQKCDSAETKYNAAQKQLKIARDSNLELE